MQEKERELLPGSGFLKEVPLEPGAEKEERF